MSPRSLSPPLVWVGAALGMCAFLVAVAGCDATGTSSETIGVTANTEPVDRCPAVSFDESAPRLDATIKLAVDTVKAGSNFEGTATFTNDGSESTVFLHSGTVYALLYQAGTDTIVAVPAETYAQMPALGLEVPAHGSASLPLLGGTIPCGPDARDVLPPGKYDVRFPLATHLSEPTTITVTD